MSCDDWIKQTYNLIRIYALCLLIYVFALTVTASSTCQQGQSEKTFPNVAFPSWFSSFSQFLQIVRRLSPLPYILP